MEQIHTSGIVTVRVCMDFIPVCKVQVHEGAQNVRADCENDPVVAVNAGVWSAAIC